jgi:hypothetical protein
MELDPNLIEMYVKRTFDILKVKDKNFELKNVLLVYKNAW